jgi:IS66 C-terminal element
MIAPASNVQVLVATKPVDFRKGADGLSAEGHAGTMALPRLGEPEGTVLHCHIGARQDEIHVVNPLAWMTDVLTKLVNVWPASRIDELMPWAYPKITAGVNSGRQS